MESKAEEEDKISHLSTLICDTQTSLESNGDLDILGKKPNWLIAWARNSADATAWFLLFRVFIFNVLTGYNFVSFSILYVEYSIYFDESKAVLGLIRSFEMGAIILGGLFMSWPIERYGYPRMTFCGSTISVVGLIAASFANSTVVLILTQGILAGIGYGMTSLITPAVIQRHFKQNRALANGIGMLGYSVGNIIGPMITKVLIDSYGWRGTLLLMGGFSLNRAVLGWTFRPPAFQSPDNKTKQISFTKALRKSLDFSLVKNKPFTIFLVSAFLQSFSVVGFVQFTPIRAVHSGISINGAAFLTTVTFIGSTSMRAVTMFVSNMKCVDYNVLFALGVMCVVPGVLFTLLLPGFYGGVIGCILVGLSVGSTNAQLALVAVELCGLDHLVRALSLITLSIGSAGLIASPFCGWLFDISGTYNLAFTIMGCSAGISCLASMLAFFVNRRIKSKTLETANPSECDSLNVAGSGMNLSS